MKLSISRAVALSSLALAVTNIYGPIIDRSAVATATVNGSSAASTMGTTDPHANITY